MSDSTKYHDCAVLVYSDKTAETIEACSVAEACEEFCARAFELSRGPWYASVLVPVHKHSAVLLAEHCIDLNPELGRQTGLEPAEDPVEFTKFDDAKLRYDLIPPEFLEGVAKVLTDGAAKYAPNNWRKNTELWRYEAAMMRHFEAYRKGELIDPDSGSPHLMHAATNLLFLSSLTCQTKP